METIHIASSCDERYFPGLLATFTSILLNADSNNKYCFYLIDGGLGDESKITLKKSLGAIYSNAKVYFFKPDLSLFDSLPKMFFGSALPYARLLLPELLTTDKVIYVDSDVLFMKNIAELWNIDLKENYAAAALDTGIVTIAKEFPDYKKFNLIPEAPFFNSGVMLLNLSAFRKHQLHLKVLRLRAQFPEYFTFHDQSPLNVVLFGNFLLLGQEWNFQTREMDIAEDFQRILKEPVNFHFSTSFKPWLIYDDNIGSILFYMLTDAIGYYINDSSFKHSRRTLKQKRKLGKLLPYGYEMRSFLKRLKGDANGAIIDEKTAAHWRKKCAENRFLWTRRKEVQNIYVAWEKKIEKALASRPKQIII